MGVSRSSAGEHRRSLLRPFEPSVQDDLDVLLEGPIVGDVVASFDLFWNGAARIPRWRSRLGDSRGRGTDRSARHRYGACRARRNAELVRVQSKRIGRGVILTGSLDATLAAGTAELFYDCRCRRSAPRNARTRALEDFVASAERDVLISSPVFHPRPRFSRVVADRSSRAACASRVVTNSLASNNHVVAHTGYQHWRRDLLRAGVELYEFRVDAAVLGEY